MSDKPLTEKRVCISLFWALRGASDLLIPRFTPRGWWECDMWRLTKAGFVDEYEIKLTVGDFKADALKTRNRFTGKTGLHWPNDRASVDETKHAILATTEEGPNRFWFVTTREIAEQIALPPWAGLMIAYAGGAHVHTAAPKRHGRKWDGNRAKLMATFYHRYWTHEAGTTSEIEPLVEEQHDATLTDEPAPLTLEQTTFA